MLLLLSLALAGPVTGEPPAARPPAIVELSAAQLLEADNRRIRSGTPRVSRMIADGARRSRTFASLVTDIHRTNVIVYVEANFNLPSDVSGRILLAGAAGGQRYLRVQVRATLQGDHFIAVVAHELRHALEVADAHNVVDEKGLAALYRRIGDWTPPGGGYDTEAARVAGRTVRAELLG